jgi:very-short-patch-repair endonuclease
MNGEAELYSVAAEQGGVIRREQAIEAGLSRHQIDSRLKSSKWAAVSKGGYRLIALNGGLEIARAAAAVLPSAVVSHFSAAQVHMMSFVPIDRASVTVKSHTTHRFPGAEIFRCIDMRQQHIEDWRGLPVTTIERTVVDLASAVSLRHLAVIVDELLASRRTTLDALDGVLGDVAKKGKPGVRAMRSILEGRSGGRQRQTKLEALGARILRSAEFPRFEVEYPLPWDSDRRYDVAFVAAQLAIEWDSFRWHSQERMFRSDRERDRDAMEHGWIVLRFTWQDVTETPEKVESSVRRLLMQRSQPSAG